MGWSNWSPYVPVAKRRQQASKKMEELRKKGVDIQPIKIEGSKIAKTFWGKAWCDHLESFSDYANRLPRGRTYVRNGSVCHLAIEEGHVEAKVSGSELYTIRVSIKTLPAKKWNAVKQQCSGKIGSLLELLQGKISSSIMEVVTDPDQGLFPLPDEISFKCSCPDWAYMCKHVAAVMYGVGARLDKDPALLFRLRGVNHEELIDENTKFAVPTSSGSGGTKRISSDNLSDVFGIDLAKDESKEPANIKSKSKAKKTASGRKKSSVSSNDPSSSPKKSGKNKTAVLSKTSKNDSEKTSPRRSAKKKPSGKTVKKG